jgi:low temperature requirement protein LtrA
MNGAPELKLEPAGGWLRPHAGQQRVTFVELFFDLIFALAVTQLSHTLLADLSLRGALRALLLLSAVWWAWIDTAWITNWFDPERRPVRLMLLSVMLVGLILSAALPEAFHARGLVFAGAYVAIQVGRSLFAVAALGVDPALRRNFQRILSWSLASGVFWLAGAAAHDGAREALWLVAALLDFAAPACGFVVPGLGRSQTSDWTITGGHLAERCQLFLILALGESILVTGATFGELRYSAGTVTAFVVAFSGSAALWWLYFDRSADAAGALIAASTDPGRLGRSAYTYCHVPMVAGIIAAAVADELTIAHPGGQTSTATALVTLGGPALFLAGHALFKWAAFGHLSAARLLAVGALAALGPLARQLPPLALATAATLVLLLLAGWDATRDARQAVAGSRAEAELELGLDIEH